MRKVETKKLENYEVKNKSNLIETKKECLLLIMTLKKMFQETVDKLIMSIKSNRYSKKEYWSLRKEE